MFDAVPWILDGTTVDAEVIRRALGSLIGSAGGVVTPGDLTVTQNGTPNMSVNVGAGQVWVPGKSTASTGPYYGRNGASVNVPITAANATNPRVDTIVVQVEDPAYGGSGSPMAPKALAGTPTAGVSTPPTTAAQAASDGAASIPSTSSAYVAAYVLVPANATTITNADISNVASTVAVASAPADIQSLVPSSWSALGLGLDFVNAAGSYAARIRSEGNMAVLSGLLQNGSGSTVAANSTVLSGIPASLSPSAAVALSTVVDNASTLAPAWLSIAAGATTATIQGASVSPGGFLGLEGLRYPVI